MEQMELAVIQPEYSEAIMALKQAPIIEENLQSVAEAISNRVNSVLERVATAGTLKEVRDLRAQLSREYRAAEARRVEFHKVYEKPYNDMMETYKRVTSAYTQADAQLKTKVDAMAAEIINGCVVKLEAHFIEARQAYGLEWLTFDRLGVKVGLTQAQQKSHKALLEQITAKVTAIHDDVMAINAMDDGPEVMAEYKQSLNLAQAVAIVKDRQERIKQEAAAREARAAQIEAERARQAEIRAAMESASPAILEAPVADPEPEPVLEVRFAVKSTMGGLKELKYFLDENGYEWRSI